MEANIYQQRARQLARYPKDNLGPYFTIMGLTASTGNIANYLKNIVLTQGPSFTKENIEDIKNECGDLMWYLANLCADLGIKFNDVMESNLDKATSINKILNQQKQEQLSNDNT